MALTAFLSCSFAKADAEVVDFFHRLIEECGLAVLTAEKEDAPFVLGKIYPKINKSDLVIGIFSPRHKISKKSHIPAPAIIYELGYATGKGKPVYGFRDKGVDVSALGLLPLDGTNFPKFDRNNLDESRNDLKQYLCSLPMLVNREIKGHFEFLQYAKDVTIYSTGYGVIRLRCTVKVTGDSFKAIPHVFGLGSSGRKTLTLPSFDVLRKGGIANRWKNKGFFAFRVIEGSFPEKDVLLTPILKDCNREKISFMIQFPKIPVGSSFSYEWSWGSPDLFPIRKEDLLPGKRKKDLDYVCSVLPSIIGDYKDFIFVIRFEGIPQFVQEPIIKVCDGAGDTITERHFEIQKSALYTNFVAKLQLDKIHGGRIEAQWKPQ